MLDRDVVTFERVLASAQPFADLEVEAERLDAVRAFVSRELCTTGRYRSPQTGSVVIDLATWKGRNGPTKLGRPEF